MPVDVDQERAQEAIHRLGGRELRPVFRGLPLGLHRERAQRLRVALRQGMEHRLAVGKEMVHRPDGGTGALGYAVHGRARDAVAPDVQRAAALMLDGPQSNIAGLVGRWVGAGERFRHA